MIITEVDTNCCRKVASCSGGWRCAGGRADEAILYLRETLSELCVIMVVLPSVCGHYGGRWRFAFIPPPSPASPPKLQLAARSRTQLLGIMQTSPFLLASFRSTLCCSFLLNFTLLFFLQHSALLSFAQFYSSHRRIIV